MQTLVVKTKLIETCCQTVSLYSTPCCKKPIVLWVFLRIRRWLHANTSAVCVGEAGNFFFFLFKLPGWSKLSVLKGINFMRVTFCRPPLLPPQLGLQYLCSTGAQYIFRQRREEEEEEWHERAEGPHKNLCRKKEEDDFLLLGLFCSKRTLTLGCKLLFFLWRKECEEGEAFHVPICSLSSSVSMSLFRLLLYRSLFSITIIFIIPSTFFFTFSNTSLTA